MGDGRENKRGRNKKNTKNMCEKKYKKKNLWNKNIIYSILNKVSKDKIDIK